MAPIVARVDIDRPPEEAFAYVTDPARFPEWQDGVTWGRVEGGAQASVGAKCTTRRKIAGAERDVTSEVTRIEPPHRWGVRGIDGPIRATVDVTVDPLDGGSRSRVTISVDFDGHNIGKLLVPLVARRQAQKEMPANVQRLKGRLETG